MVTGNTAIQKRIQLMNKFKNMLPRLLFGGLIFLAVVLLITMLVINFKIIIKPVSVIAIPALTIIVICLLFVGIKFGFRKMIEICCENEMLSYIIPPLVVLIFIIICIIIGNMSLP